MADSSFRQLSQQARRATSELLVIIIGVLIALTAENVREGWRERGEVREYLVRIEPEVATVRFGLQAAIDSDSTIQLGLEELARSLRSDVVLSSDSVRSLFRLVVPVPTLSVPTLALLVDTKDLKLVESGEIRGILVEAQREIERTEGVLASSNGQAWALIERMYSLQEPLLRESLTRLGAGPDSLSLAQGERASRIDYHLLREEPEIAVVLQSWAQLLRNHGQQFANLDSVLARLEEALAGNSVPP